MSTRMRTFDAANNRAQESSWSYAVPSQDENFSNSNSRGHSAQNSYTSQRQPLSNYPNPVSSQQGRQGPALGPQSSSDSVRTRQTGLKPPFQEQDRASSGNDSLLDLYRSDPVMDTATGNVSNSLGNEQRNSRKRVASQERSKIRRKGSRGGASTIEPPPVKGKDEESKWIHRDKLAQIESRELAEMGIRVGRPSRANSRTKSVRTAKSTVDAQEPAPVLPEEDEAVRRESFRLLEPVDDGMQESTAQEVTDNPTNHVFQRSEDRTPVSRPGTSRIPVRTASYDEDNSFDARRKRSGSFDALNSRTRSRSGGSQHLLDGANGSNLPTSPQQSSPPKQRTVSKGIPTSNRKPSGQRKTSTSTPRSRANSTTESPKRPGTSSGPRPTTARPEGEAPWIATMYKPDPLLPPEQQMLPTHAKRLAQMQAEAGGKPVVEPERDEFTLVESNDDKDNQMPVETDQMGDLQASNEIYSKRSSKQQKRSSTQQAGQWPLQSPSQQGIESRLSPRPDGERGSYNLMPRMPSSSDPEKRGSTQTRASHRTNGSYAALSDQEKHINETQSLSQLPVTLAPQPEEEYGKKNKKCMACCVVM